jgi:hypothetical protein
MQKSIFAYLRFYGLSPAFIHLKKVLALAILASILFISPASAFKTFEDFLNTKSHDPQVQIQAFTNPGEVHPGESFKIHLRVNIGENWHIYSIKNQGEDELLNTKIIFDQDIFQSKEEWEESPPKLARDEVLQKTIKTHQKLAEFNRLQMAPRNLKPGVYNVSGSFLFRACDNKVCTLQKKTSFMTQVKILGKI